MNPSLQVVDAEITLRQLSREEHQLACERAIALRDVTYGRDRTSIEKRIEAEAMSLCLESVPTEEVTALMKTELQNRTNPFPPKAPDLLRRWKGEEWVENDGGSERVTVANASAYLPLQPTENEKLFKRPDLKMLPGGGGAMCECAQCRQVRAKLKANKRQAEAAPVPAAIIRLKPRDEKMLGTALYEWTHFEPWRIKRELWTAFGWWLLDRTPVDEWTPDLGRAMWLIWQDERQPQATKEATG